MNLSKSITRPGGDVLATCAASKRLADDELIEAASNQGLKAFAEGNFADAVRCYLQVIEARHDDAETHNRLGLAYLKQGSIEEAADCFAMAAHYAPAFAEAHFNLALAAREQGDLARARTDLEEVLSLSPEHAEAHNALGAVELESGDVAKAAECFERAIDIKQDYGSAHSNLGYVLFRDLGDYERGARHIQRALDLNAGDANAWCNYTMVLSHQGRIEEAISVCNQLLAAKPQMHEARLNRALAELKLGRYATAWTDYEARKQVRSNYIPRPFAFPEWKGEALTGKNILVYGEQGLGDEIMFASCLPDLHEVASRCVIECAPRLAPLFGRSFPWASVHAGSQSDRDMTWLAAQPRVDVQTGIGSLPGYFRRSGADFPHHHGYLRADPQRIAYWRQRLSALGAGLKVGISWSGGMASTRRNLRSTALAEWLPVVRLSARHFVSLQYGNVEAELGAFNDAFGANVHSWPDAQEDYEETAALISALDLVISVQTAVVHLSGALGKKTWVMVPEVAEWRYLQYGESMPWYPSVRLFRQQRANNWHDVIDAVATELRKVAIS